MRRNSFFGSQGARVARAIHALLPGFSSHTAHAPDAATATAATAVGRSAAHSSLNRPTDHPASSPDPHAAFVELERASGAASLSAAGAHSGSDSFVVRARSPWKASLRPASLSSAAEWVSLLASVGWGVAAAHARSDDEYDARFVPHSFERGFMQLVPRAVRDEWMDDLLTATFDEVSRRHGDYACWQAHAQAQPDLRPEPRDEEEEEDDAED